VPNLNKVFLMGNITRDPELRYTPSGTAVADFGLAVNRRWTGGNGERKEETLFVDVTVWSRSAEMVSEYCRKGDPIFVEGRLQLDTWDGPDGQKRSRLRVVAENFQFLTPRGARGATQSGEEGPPSGRPPQAGGRTRTRPPAHETTSAGEPPPEAESQDDVPF